MRTFPIQLRLTGQPVLLLGHGDAADAKARQLEAAGARLVRGDHIPEPLDPAIRLAVLALPRDAARTLAAQLKARSVLVNVVDQSDLCDFMVPSFVDRDPVMIAIGTGGLSASLARQIRERLEALLPASLGPLAEAIASRRKAVSAALPTPADRRRFWDDLLGPGRPLDPFAPVPDDAAAHIDRALAGASPAAGIVLELLLASGDPDDLTLRQLRLLQRADVLVAGDDVPAAILDRARRDAVRTNTAPPDSAGQVICLISWPRSVKGA